MQKQLFGIAKQDRGRSQCSYLSRQVCVHRGLVTKPPPLRHGAAFFSLADVFRVVYCSAAWSGRIDPPYRNRGRLGRQGPGRERTRASRDGRLIGGYSPRRWPRRVSSDAGLPKRRVPRRISLADELPLPILREEAQRAAKEGRSLPPLSSTLALTLPPASVERELFFPRVEKGNANGKVQSLSTAQGPGPAAARNRKTKQ